MGAILSLLGLGQPQQQAATNKVVEYGKNLEKRVAKKQKKNVEETKKAVIEADKEAVTKKKTIDDDVKLDEIVKDSMKKEVDTETAVKKKMIVSNAKVTEDALKAERVKNAAKKAELEEKIKLLQAQRDEAVKKRKASETREKEAIKAAQVAKAARKEQEKTLNKTTKFLKTVKAEERDAKKRMLDLRTKCSRYEERRTDICRSMKFCNTATNAIDNKGEFRDRCRPLFKKLNIPMSMLKKMERRIRKLARESKKNRFKLPKMPKMPKMPKGFPNKLTREERRARSRARRDAHRHAKKEKRRIMTHNGLIQRCRSSRYYKMRNRERCEVATEKGFITLPSKKELTKHFMKQSVTVRPPPPDADAVAKRIDEENWGKKLTRKDKFILRKCARIPRDGSPPWRERRNRNEKRCKRLEKKRARISKKAIGSAGSKGFIPPSYGRPPPPAPRPPPVKSKMSLSARENNTLRNCRSKNYRRMRPGKCRRIRDKARALKLPTWNNY